MKADIRQTQLEGLLRLPEKDVEQEALMWQTVQFRNLMEEKYPVLPSRDHPRYEEWHFDMNTLRGACQLYSQWYGSELLEDYMQLVTCDTDRIEKNRGMQHG